MTTPVEKSTNPATNTAAQTVGGAPPPIRSRRGTRAPSATRSTVRAACPWRRDGHAAGPRRADHYQPRVLDPDTFLFTKTNIANLMTQTAALMMLAVALTFVIILAEIDLSAGVTGGLGMAIFILLTNVVAWNWIAALLVALVLGAAIGTFIGFMVARIGVSVVRHHLALFLGLQGVILVLLGNAGAYRIEARPYCDHEQVHAGLGRVVDARRHRRHLAAHRALRPQPTGRVRHAGPSDEPTVGTRRSLGSRRRTGRPYAEPEQVDERDPHPGRADRRAHCAPDPLGRHGHARPHPVRPAPVCGWRQSRGGQAGRDQRRPVRMAAFILCSSLAVVSGLFTASQVGTVESSAGRDIVLSGVAAAVVGGVSLFGGRGRLAQAAVGALLISMITNGLGLLGLSAGITLAITGAVLALAATVDALSRRRSGATSLAR